MDADTLQEPRWLFQYVIVVRGWGCLPTIMPEASDLNAIQALSRPYSGKPWTHLRVLNATSASSREAVFAPAPAAVPTDLYDFFHALLVFPDFGFM